MTIVGTRPEIIRLAEVIKELDRCFDHTLVHTGQNWTASLNEVFFSDLNLRSPDHNLSVVGHSLGETLGNIIASSYAILQEVKPDALLLLGDTNSALSAISAKRLKIPIFHMEAGNRCFDQNVPEEINRRIVDHISDVNLAYTEHSRRYLLREGISPDFVFVTGSPMKEVLQTNSLRIGESKVLSTLGLTEKKYFVVSLHREENVDNDETLRNLLSAISDACEEYGYDAIASLHPRTANKLKEKNHSVSSKIKLYEPFGFLDYIKLQKHSFCVISDSGTLSEESTMLGFSGVLIRSSTERPEVLDSGTTIVGGTDSHSVLEAIRISTLPSACGTSYAPPDDYLVDDVSRRVARIIASYSHIVRKRVWGSSR